MNTIRRSDYKVPREHNPPKQKHNPKDDPVSSAQKPKVNSSDREGRLEEIEKKQIKSHGNLKSTSNSHKHPSAKNVSHSHSSIGGKVDIRA